MSSSSDKTLEFQCPKCARRLKAPPQAVGKRFKCPSCGEPVVVPDSSTPTHSSEEQPSVSAAADNSEPLKVSDVTSSPPPRLTSIFDDDLPELAELEAPRPRTDLNTILGGETLDALLGANSSAPPSTSASKAAVSKPSAAKTTGGQGTGLKGTEAKSKEPGRKAAVLDPAQQQYRVACPSCGTPQYVTVAMKGRTVRCPDCFLEFKIPPPPPNWKPSDKPAHTNWGTGLAEQPPGEAARDAARSRAHADEYLRRAEKELAEEDIDSLYAADFDTESFVNRTFGFVFDGAALFQVILYSVMFAIFFTAAQWCAVKMAEGDKGVVLVLGIAIPLMFIIVAFPMFAAAMTMLESIANGQRKVREWPGFNFYDHIGELLLFGAALAASAIPGFLIGGWIGRTGGMAWMVILGTLLSTFLTFPIILLSMLDNESLFNPVSPDVLKSLSGGYESWGVYYFKTFVAFSFVFISWCVLWGGNPLLAGIAGAMLPWLIFFMCQQLGVLALDISEQLSLNLADEEPDEESDDDGDGRTKIGSTP